MNKKIAVIGAGIYGVTIALKLASKGFLVDLFEAKSSILSSTSSINQYRVHKGYHYPRCKDTLISCRDNEELFRNFYKDSILSNVDHFYSISSRNSYLSGEQYLRILKENDLEWDLVDTQPNCDLTVKVKEHLFCPIILKEVCKNKLLDSKVNVILNTKINSLESLTGYNFIVVSTYRNINSFKTYKTLYQYELCEKPLFYLPENYSNKSHVILDGPFMCFDPYSKSGLHVGGNVVHAIHSSNVGLKANIPSYYKEVLDKGVVKNPKYTNASKFLKSATEFFPGIEKAKHVGSMFTIRTVLPFMEETDSRLSSVESESNKIFVFSGKITNCVESANKVVKLVA